MLQCIHFGPRQQLAWGFEDALLGGLAGDPQLTRIGCISANSCTLCSVVSSRATRASSIRQCVQRVRVHGGTHFGFDVAGERHVISCRLAHAAPARFLSFLWFMQPRLALQSRRLSMLHILVSE
jgi:hypothetical protein